MSDDPRSRLAARYRLTITTLSPVHVGAGGGPLKAAIPDFLRVGDRIVVVDPGKLGDLLSQAQLAQLGGSTSLGDLLRGLSDEELEAAAAYFLPAAGSVNAILPHIKLLDGQPYIPGSSLKGALRTALAFAILRSGTFAPSTAQLDRRRERADDSLDRDLFGEDPNHDLLRVLHVGDTDGVAAVPAIVLRRAQVFSLLRRPQQPQFQDLSAKVPESEYSFFLETIPEGTTLEAVLRRDNYLLDPKQADVLGFSPRRDVIANLVAHCNTFAQTLVDREHEFYHIHGPRDLDRFYNGLANRLQNIDPARECLLQIAWGTGWHAKTLGLALGDDYITHIRNEYRLGRTGWAFPKSRRLVEDRNGHWVAMGWLHILFEPVGDVVDLEPATAASRRRDQPARPERRPRTAGPSDRSRTTGRLLADLTVGEQLEGTVRRVADFGAFVDVGAERDGLVHISKLKQGYVHHPSDVVQEGQRVTVWVITIDLDRGRLGLTMVQPNRA
jgi:CRISPR type III-A-associated RAMP protein Csm5